MTSPPGLKTRRRGAVTGSPDHRPRIPVAESDHFQLDERPDFRGRSCRQTDIPRLRPACDPPLRAGFVFLGSRLLANQLQHSALSGRSVNSRVGRATTHGAADLPAPSARPEPTIYRARL